MSRRHEGGAASRQKAERRAQALAEAARLRQEQKRQEATRADVQKCSDVAISTQDVDEHGQPLPPDPPGNWI